MNEKQVKAILTALKEVGRVELTLEKDGSVTIRTVTRKRVKI